MSDLGQILIDSHSGDDRVRNEAETILSQYRDNDFAEFCYALTVELANEQGDPIARQMAGLVLKINLDSKQQDIKEQLWNRWLMVSGEVRDQVKMGLLQTLASATREAAMTAAQVTAKVAAIELENQSWPDLIETLLNNMQTPDAGHKRATLDALGYICENVSVQALEASINTILTAIVQGMQAAEVNNDVRFAATLALNNALEFIVEPFENDAERDYIMTVVCEATQCEDVRVRQAAMECLVKIVQFFYDKMEPYMEALFQLTFEAIRSDPEQSALQAIEFWSTICEEEMYLNDMLVRATREDRRPEAFSSDYITAALEYLVPMLLQTLTRQMDDQDEDTWNISMAAGTCLNLVTKTVSDAVVEHVVPFVTDNVESNDWHFREAAVFAFGSMMEGTSSEELEELINQGLPIFVNLMGDEHILVAETSAWTLGRVCKFHAAVVSPENVDPLVVALTSGLESPARVATNCCWSFNNLAGAFAGTEVLSPYFNVVLPALLDVTERPDWHEASLRTAAYTAINELIQIATADTTDAVFATFRILLDRLEGTLRVNDGNQGDLQGLLCAALQVITQKVGDEMVEFGDTLMELYLGVFQSNQNSVHEEALLAVGALATAIEGNFQKYVPDFISWLLLGLKNYAEYEVCTIAVGVVGDVCRALEKNVLPYCNDIVGILLADLRNPLLHRDVKPAILSCFGDIALAVGGHFEDYLQVCMNVLNEASLLQLDQTNEELREYQNELREHIFEGYTGVIQGLNGDDQAHQLAEYVEHIMQFIDFVYRDPYRDEAVTRGAVGVLGDIAHAMGSDVAHFLAFDFVQPIIRDCSNGEEEESIETANFTRSVVKKLLQRNQGGGKSF